MFQESDERIKEGEVKVACLQSEVSELAADVDAAEVVQDATQVELDATKVELDATKVKLENFRRDLIVRNLYEEGIRDVQCKCFPSGVCVASARAINPCVSQCSLRRSREAEVPDALLSLVKYKGVRVKPIGEHDPFNPNVKWHVAFGGASARFNRRTNPCSPRLLGTPSSRRRRLQGTATKAPTGTSISTSFCESRSFFSPATAPPRPRRRTPSSTIDSAQWCTAICPTQRLRRSLRRGSWGQKSSCSPRGFPSEVLTVASRQF